MWGPQLRHCALEVTNVEPWRSRRRCRVRLVVLPPRRASPRVLSAHEESSPWRLERAVITAAHALRDAMYRSQRQVQQQLSVPRVNWVDTLALTLQQLVFPALRDFLVTQ